MGQARAQPDAADSAGLGPPCIARLPHNDGHSQAHAAQLGRRQLTRAHSQQCTGMLVFIGMQGHGNEVALKAVARMGAAYLKVSAESET